MDRKRVSLGPNVRQSVSLIDQSLLNEESLLQPVGRDRRSMIQHPRQSARRTSIVPRKQQLSSDEIKKMYAECYLLCDQRKVTEKNAWTLPLIDYIDEWIEVDTTDSKGSANFVKAGMAIDAGVQIYSVRVDAVHKKTFAVVDTIRQAEVVDDGDLSSFDETPEKLLEDETQQTQHTQHTQRQRKKKTTTQQKPTIEKKPQSLLSKSVKPDYNLDRLFHKRISALEGKSLLQDVVHNYGDFLSGDYDEVIDIDEEEPNWDNPEVEWGGKDISNLNITEIGIEGKSMLVQSIVEDLQTPASSQPQPLDTIDRIMDELPDDEPTIYVDQLNPIGDDGDEILPTNEEIAIQRDLLAPTLEKGGFTYFDPNLYNVKQIRLQIRQDIKTGKFMKKHEPKKRERKEKQDMFDIRGKRVEEFDKLFNKKSTTTEIKYSNKFRVIGKDVDVNEMSKLMLVPLKGLGKGEEKVVENALERKESILQSRLTTSGIRQSLSGIRPSLAAKQSVIRMDEDEDDDENARMIIRSEDDENDDGKSHTKSQAFSSVAVPRMINFEKNSEKAIVKVLQKWKENGNGNKISFQQILDGIVPMVKEEERKDLSVHYVFVALNILCFLKGYQIIKEGENDIYLQMN
ncbi:Condensin complex subunit 2 [Entamoeba marina]